MIIYNKTWLINEEARYQIDHAFQAKAITNEEKKMAEDQFTVGFYTPNYFIRVGLFLLTGVIVICSFGLACLIMLSSVEKALNVMLGMFALVSYFVLEGFVKTKNHFRSGVDDALLWATGLAIITAINFDNNISSSANALIIAVLAIFFTLRFADMLMAAIATAAVLAFIFYITIHIGPIGKQIVSFVIVICSAIIYFAAKRTQTKVPFYYRNCLIIAEIVSLIILYASTNYFIVREIGNSLLGTELAPGQQIPLHWLFWFLTVFVPIVYIFFGLYKKDVVLLRVGLLLIAAIVFTVRNYYHLFPAELLMLSCGAGMILLAWAIIRWLATPKKGFTSAEGGTRYMMDHMNAEALLIAETFAGTGKAPDSKFGGGDFGGGGASGEF